jgi:hypothetical protein
LRSAIDCFFCLTSPPERISYAGIVVVVRSWGLPVLDQ